MKKENKKRNKRRKVKSRKEDYISKLPKNILCSILSHLKVKEAVKTSILSPEWKNISSNPINLVLDAANILKIEQIAPNAWHQNLELRSEYKRNRTLAFVSNVNKYLSYVEEVQKIDKLKVFFTFRRDEQGSTDLDQWIRFAIARNVEEINLCLLEENHHHHLRFNDAANDNGGVSSLHVFPCDDVFGNYDHGGAKSLSLKSLHLEHCVLAPHMSHKWGFSTLTTMELFKVDLKSEEHIKILLACCTNLEWLGFSECYNMENLVIENPFCQKLKHLNVKLCQQLKKLVLQCTTLETLEYKGRKIEFVFEAPRLKTFYSPVSDTYACHNELWPVFRLPIDMPQLETLIMECSCTMGKVMRNRFPTITFRWLRHLEIIKVAIFQQNMWLAAKILNSCPILERLELHQRTYISIDEEEVSEKDLPPTFSHNFLKEVVITGIRGYCSEIEIAIYLLRNAIALEKMTIDPRVKVYLGNGNWGQGEALGNWSMVGRQKVHQHLSQEANASRVELLIK